MTQYLQLVTTTDSEAEAKSIAGTLIERRLAACVQILGPIESVYRWEGTIETAREWQCLAKTAQDLFSAAESAIREVHSYDVPEILAFPVAAGSDSYCAWMDDQLGRES